MPPRWSRKTRHVAFVGSLKAPNNLLGDGVNQSAQPFNNGFPYLSQPYQGFARAGGTATSPTGAP